MTITFHWSLSLSGNATSVAVLDVSYTGPIFLDDVVCEGRELSLLQCSHSRQHNCKESDLAGVICGGMYKPYILYIYECLL